MFTIDGSASATIEDLAITGGQALEGGGVESYGGLTMMRDQVTANLATGGVGGIAGHSSTIVDDSAIYGNDGMGQGGGVFLTGQASLTRDLIARNTVTGPLGSVGGGVDLWTPTRRFPMTRSRPMRSRWRQAAAI